MISGEQLAMAIDRWGGKLRFWLMTRVPDFDDILQETFCKLIQQPHWPDRPAAWLFQVAANLIRQEARRKKRRQQREERVALPEAIQIDGDFGWTQDEIQKAMSRLTAELRDIILLKIWGEMTHAEIGKSLGISTASAHRRYEEALVQLRLFFEEQNTRIRKK